jgi:hypothetical protein
LVRRPHGIGGRLVQAPRTALAARLALVAAIATNADSIYLAQRLSSDAVLRQACIRSAS